MPAEPLQPTATATTIRKENGKALILDGPFAETKEQLAGYYILDCTNLDEAIAWAAKIPTACKGAEGCIEVRPIADIPAALGAAANDRCFGRLKFALRSEGYFAASMAGSSRA